MRLIVEQIQLVFIYVILTVCFVSTFNYYKNKISKIIFYRNISLASEIKVPILRVGILLYFKLFYNYCSLFCLVLFTKTLHNFKGDLHVVLNQH